MEKLADKELESVAHRTAFALLNKTLETQPNLISNPGVHGTGGVAVGTFLTTLYDQLLVLARKNIAGEENQ